MASDLYYLLINNFSQFILPRIIELIIFLAPIFIPIILLKILWPIWLSYVRARYILEQKYTLLEIKMPKESTRSPMAMEVALNVLHDHPGSTWIDRFWHGKTRSWYSLEIVSLEGQVGFYIWTKKDKVNVIEASFYSQFPNIEIKEVEDYTKNVHYHKGVNDIWACELKLVKPDFYPIKTYVDYGLDKDPKEEFKIDPIAPLLEYLGTVGVNQQIWIQMLVSSHGKEFRSGAFTGKDEFSETAKSEINKMISRDPKTKYKIVDKDSKLGIVNTKGEEEVVYAIERALRKPQFDVIVRALYVGKKENFNKGEKIGGIIGSFKQFGSEHLNSFGPNTNRLMMGIGMPWADFLDIRKEGAKQYSLDVYKMRAGHYFHNDPFIKKMVLNTEELATMFHFPGGVVSTPSFDRLLTKKSEPPANLPI